MGTPLTKTGTLLILVSNRKGCSRFSVDHDWLFRTRLLPGTMDWASIAAAILPNQQRGTRDALSLQFSDRDLRVWKLFICETSQAAAARSSSRRYGPTRDKCA